MCYQNNAWSEGIECLPDESKSVEIEEHAHEEPSWGRVCMGAGQHDVVFCVQGAEPLAQSPQHLSNIT